MKRHRVLPFLDFDTRALSLSNSISDDWEESVKVLHRRNREQTIAELKFEFGERHSEAKIQNFMDLGATPLSIVAFHNAFFSQVRTAFVMGGYYPALTGACALGERVLNHLLLKLRDDYRSTPEYKRVYGKDSFDDWTLAIDTLEAWAVLLPAAVTNFRALMKQRHRAIHFRPETDKNVRALSLEAIACLQRIIGDQFSGFGAQPWFMTGVPGEAYIKKEWESKPFIQRVYLPNTLRVGPRNRIESMVPQIVVMDPDKTMESEEVSDEEFESLRRAFNDGGR